MECTKFRISRRIRSQNRKYFKYLFRSSDGFFWPNQLKWKISCKCTFKQRKAHYTTLVNFFVWPIKNWMNLKVSETYFLPLTLPCKAYFQVKKSDYLNQFIKKLPPQKKCLIDLYDYSEFSESYSFHTFFKKILYSLFFCWLLIPNLRCK